MSESSDGSYQSDILENEPEVLVEKEESEESAEEEVVEQISGENIDLDFDQGDDDISVEEEEEDELLDIDKLNVVDLYLLILKKLDNYKDFIGKIVEHNTEHIIFSNEYQEEDPDKIKRMKINLDDKGIVLKLEDGTEIIEILNIKEVNPEEVLIEDDIFKEDEIKLKVIELDNNSKNIMKQKLKKILYLK